MKTIGIIGGFGPEATAQFYQEVIHVCRLSGVNTQPHLIVWNVAVPQALEETLLLHNKSLHRFLPLLSGAARGLALAGADRIVLPCNTLHTVAHAITSATSVPFISIVDNTIAKLQIHKVQEIGILGSCVTVTKNPFAKADPTVTFVPPTSAIQKHIDMGLHQFVSMKQSSLLQVALKDAVSQFKKKGIQHMLIACTDFHTLIPAGHGLTVFDTLDILVTATVKQMVGNKAKGMI